MPMSCFFRLIADCLPLRIRGERKTRGSSFLVPTCDAVRRLWAPSRYRPGSALSGSVASRAFRCHRCLLLDESVRRDGGFGHSPSPKGRGDEKSYHFVLFMYAGTLRPYVTVGQNLCCSLAGAHRLVPRPILSRRSDWPCAPTASFRHIDLAMRLVRKQCPTLDRVAGHSWMGIHGVAGGESGFGLTHTTFCNAPLSSATLYASRTSSGTLLFAKWPQKLLMTFGASWVLEGTPPEANKLAGTYKYFIDA